MHALGPALGPTRTAAETLAAQGGAKPPRQLPEQLAMTERTTAICSLVADHGLAYE